MRGASQVVTVWNRWRNPATQKDEWFSHTLLGCSWEHRAVRAVSGQTASIAGVISVLIAESPNYRPPKAWEALEDKTLFFTLQIGDLLALGGQAVEITGVAPYRETDVRQSLAPEVLTIKVVQDNTAGYKRGRHYYVEGV